MAFVDSLFRQRRRMVAEFSEDWLSCACKWVLITIPLFFVIGHVLSVDAQANFYTGWRFGLLDFSISSYLWRSPGSWAVVASMMGCALVLGFISWSAAHQGPGFFSWFTTVVAALAMVSVFQASWHPFSPSREDFAKIQEEIRHEARTRSSEEVWIIAIGMDKTPESRRMKSIRYLRSLRSHWLHESAFFQSQLLFVLTMFGSEILWWRRVADQRRWTRSTYLVLGFTMMALVGGMLTGYVGLFERVVWVLWYGWLWLVFREIKRQTNLKEAQRSWKSSSLAALRSRVWVGVMERD